MPLSQDQSHMITIAPKITKEVMHIRMMPMGDQALYMIFGNHIDPTIHRQIRGLIEQLQQQPIRGVVEWVPTYHSLTLFYQPEQISYHELSQRLAERFNAIQQTDSLAPTRTLTIPVLYGNPWGLDFQRVAEENELSTDEVISLHTQPTYLVYMIGFTPGFPYLGGMSSKLTTPRLENPRKKVVPGAVGIADQQTGIYSLPTPGGWNLIGRTPLRLFDPKRNPPALLQMGDQIRFQSIDQATYQSIETATERDPRSITEWIKES